MAYLTIAERTHERWHRKHVIIHDDDFYYFAEFDNLSQLERFSDTLGFAYELKDERDTTWCGNLKDYTFSHTFRSKHFTKLDDLPNGAKKIKALSNGSVVDCYFTNDGATITFYRPNPNYKDIYIPLSTSLHVAHQKLFGVY